VSEGADPAIHRAVSEPAYDRIGIGYSAVRRPEPRIAARIEAALGEARSVLNVGAGTGSYEPADREVTAVEPSQTMIDQRPAGSAPVFQGLAEDLPFGDDSFDAAMAMITVHHWRDMPAGLAEMRRVARRRVVVLTFDPTPAADLWLCDYFPAALEYHAAAMPPIAELAALLPGATVETIPIPRECSDGFFLGIWDRPEMHLDPAVRRGQSAWTFLADGVEAAIVERLRSDLQSGAWDARFGALRNAPELVGSLRIVVSSPSADSSHTQP